MLALPVYGAEFKSVKIIPSSDPDSLETKACGVFARIANTKAGCDLFAAKGRTLKIKLVRKDGYEYESYELKSSGSTVTVSASDSHGLMYGLGRVLHRSSFWGGKVVPGDMDGLRRPEKPVRGIYFATHFRNFYESAPLEEIRDYVEELAMWGYNAMVVWFDMHQYTGIDDPAARDMISRLAFILKAGRAVGMKSGLTMLANEGYKTTPKELRASRVPYTGFYGCEICPSKPGGTELIVRNRVEMLKVFASLGIPVDSVWLWPYDQGGCTCPDCSPWGGNGFVKLTKVLAGEIRALLPSTSIVLSTWVFDYKDEDKGEWRGLADAFSKEKPWVDCILADSHGTFPAYLMSHPVPGGLPMINFPEISMYMHNPWGGYGANPLPEHYHSIYTAAAPKLEGGYPYSEGIFEDFNKVQYANMYWDSSLTPEELTKEYVMSEFPVEFCDRICRDIFGLEKNFGMRTKFAKGRPDYVTIPGTDVGAKRIFEDLKDIDSRLPEEARNSWRWRILLIRSELDILLRESGGRFTGEADELFLELIRISHLEKADRCLRPPFTGKMTAIPN